MRARQILSWLSGLIVLLPLPAFAANQTVQAGTGSLNMEFSPATVTINRGESVTFTNTGLGGGHNVHADDDSFRCANGCDGQGGNGNVSSALWSSTVTFNTAGTFGYYCENHGSKFGGMRGTVIVNDVASAGQPIVGGISGNWFNPTANQGGHGFQFEVLPGNGMLAIWFVFNPDGSQQNWIYSQGTYDTGSNDATLPAFLEQGGAFPPNFDGSKVTAPPWGTLEFKFTDCDHGTAEWTPNATADAAGYHQVTFPIQRLSHIQGAACP